jgi:HAE1 family hydrophobic/amphiphilic exporter-1
MERNEAVLTAGPTRLRPILMTASAAILGMLPLALALGRGSEVQAPMATAVIGGLTTSTLLTLFVVPTVYTVFDDIALRLRRKREES